MAILPFSDADSDQGINEQLLREYAFFLAKKGIVNLAIIDELITIHSRQKWGVSPK